MTSVIRAFVAIEMPAIVQRKLDEITGKLQSELKGVQVRWVKAANMHLTLKFLGDVSQANLPLLKELLTGEAVEHKPFEISIGEVGAFPTLLRARVLWVGVTAPPELLGLQQGIENQTIRMGYPREERKFSPHLTLGRVGHSAGSEDQRRIGEALKAAQVGLIGTALVNSVNLYKSDLTSGGSVYTCLASMPLRGD